MKEELIIAHKICNFLEIGFTDIVKKKHGKNNQVALGDLILAILEHKEKEEIAKALNIGLRAYERLMPALIGSKIPQQPGVPWKLKLTRAIGIQQCFGCKRYLELNNEVFGNVKSSITGLNGLCKECDNKRSMAYKESHREQERERSKKHYYENKSDYIARNARRRASELNATPKWADLEKIKEIYRNRPEGFHVDHIVPLQGANVCGLHVEYNLQYLPAGENLRKTNTFEE